MADMVRRIQAAVAARRDPDFLVIARSDAWAVEGLQAGAERAWPMSTPAPRCCSPRPWPTSAS